jgi:hypothetical protein
MPGAQWFPDGTLNYAEHALRTPPGMTDDHVAVLTVVEGGADSTLTIGSAAGPGRTAAGLGVALVPTGLRALVGFLATAALGLAGTVYVPALGTPTPGRDDRLGGADQTACRAGLRPRPVLRPTVDPVSSGTTGLPSRSSSRSAACWSIFKSLSGGRMTSVLVW